MNYYYLTAQLPYLIYGQPAPMTVEAFMAQCREALIPQDAAMLELCVLSPDSGENTGTSGSEFIDQWRNWERSLRLNLVRFRARQLKREGSVPIDIPEFPQDAVNAAKNAVSMDSPLEAEFYLDKARWDAIENFQGWSYFHINTIYAYLLKLQLLERRALFNAEEGFAEYKELYAAIADGSPSGAGSAPQRNESGEPK